VNNNKTAVLLINVGTPDKPTVKYVRKYLFQFLNDRRVIDLPWLLQKILVNLIIVPFRAPKSTLLYKQLWTENGSPLLHYSHALRDKLQQQLSDTHSIYIAMRYQNPSIKSTLDKIKKRGHQKIVVLPMFPQYASSTTGTAVQEVYKWAGKMNVVPEIRTINQFYQHHSFIDAFAQRIQNHHPDEYDHVVFSYHGLPLRHLDKSHPEVSNVDCSCHIAMTAHGHKCYRATCYETTRLLAEKLQMPKDKYSVAFQSRLSENWMKPFADKKVVELAQKGFKKVLFVAPSFVADCLETTVEIGYEYHELFKENGGQQLTLVESLNDFGPWVEGLVKIINDASF